MVVHTSNRKGEVDPRAQELHEKLKKQLRYKSMRVIQEERVDLQMNQVGTVAAARRAQGADAARCTRARRAC